MWRFYVGLVVVWVALMPPLFTAGACTAEFEGVNSRLMHELKSLQSPETAREFFRSRGDAVSLVTPEQCRQSKPRFLDRCGVGSLVYAKLPVQNRICSIYRDDSIKVLLQYDSKGFLLRFNTDMAPFKSLRVPFTGQLIHWGR